MKKLLLAILILSGLILLGMALWQWRRGKKLALAANDLDLSFSTDDPFDLPKRYISFAIMQAGHSAQANHVIFGRLHGLSVRAFDLRYEAGHGTQRQLRRHSVIAVEGDWNLPALILLSRSFAMPLLPASDLAPVSTHWQAMGDMALAQRLAAAASPDAELLIETRREVVMAVFARPLGPDDLKEQLRNVAQWVELLCPGASRQGAGRSAADASARTDVPVPPPQRMCNYERKD